MYLVVFFFFNDFSIALLLTPACVVRQEVMGGYLPLMGGYLPWLLGTYLERGYLPWTGGYLPWMGGTHPGQVMPQTVCLLQLSARLSCLFFNFCCLIIFRFFFLNSDGSISYHQNADELTIKITEPTDAATGTTTSAFSKLKVKMSNLALPTIPSQQAKRQAQEDMAADNRLKSQLQYRHLDTKILLL